MTESRLVLILILLITLVVPWIYLFRLQNNTLDREKQPGRLWLVYIAWIIVHLVLTYAGLNLTDLLIFNFIFKTVLFSIVFVCCGLIYLLPFALPYLEKKQRERQRKERRKIDSIIPQVASKIIFPRSKPNNIKWNNRISHNPSKGRNQN
jgi:hypothetical protein